jgi:hypothetical protein
VTVTTRPAFSVGNPVSVPVRFLDSGRANNDVARDGRLFLGVVSAGPGASGAAPLIQVVLNWQEELKAPSADEIARPCGSVRMSIPRDKVGTWIRRSSLLDSSAPRLRNCFQLRRSE